VTWIATEIDFIQRILGTVSLTLQQWLLCIAVAFLLLIIDEIIKSFLRRNRAKSTETQPAVEAAPSNQPSTA
jgi:Ca2+-transporting ATPase